MNFIFLGIFSQWYSMAVRWICECVTICNSFPVSRLLHHRRALFCQWCLPTRRDVRNQTEDVKRGRYFKSYAFLLLSLAFSPLSALSLPIFMTDSLFFDNSLSGWIKASCEPGEKLKNPIIMMFISCCYNAKFSLLLLCFYFMCISLFCRWDQQQYNLTLSNMCDEELNSTLIVVFSWSSCRINFDSVVWTVAVFFFPCSYLF